MKRGPGGSRNRAYEISSGEHIVFHDADDYYAINTLSHMSKQLTASGADICFTPFACETENGTRSGPRMKEIPTSPQHMLCGLLREDWYPPLAIMWRRSFFDSVGGWNADIVRNDDGELMARAMLRRPRLTHVDSGLPIYFQHGSASRVSRQADQEHFRRSVHMLLKLRVACEGSEFDIATPHISA